MNSKTSYAIVLALAGVLSSALVSSTQAATTGIKAGVLQCVVAPGVGFVIGSSKDVRCTFRGQGRVERYRGSTGKLGLDIGVTNKSYLSWLVFAPGKVGRGALAGTYVGASAQATVIAGLGANVLVGGSSQSINLQPLSTQGQTGLNIAAGFASLDLTAVR